jgi:hypothetical protein
MPRSSRRDGEAGLALMPEVQPLDDAMLLRIQAALIRGSSLDEVQAIWQVAPPGPR